MGKSVFWSGRSTVERGNRSVFAENAVFWSVLRGNGAESGLIEKEYNYIYNI